MKKIRPLRFVPLAFLAMLFVTSLAHAHGLEHHEEDGVPGPRSVHELLRTWGWEPGSLIGLTLSAGLYVTGLSRTWREADIGHGIRKWEAWCFAAGWFALFVALVSPLHPWGQILFSAHMTQHEILMLLAAPLLVLGKPMIAFLRGLPPAWTRALAQVANQSWWNSIWCVISSAFAAWLIHALVLWVWHVPALFQATLHNDWIHALQHVCFLFSAILFWWALLQGGHRAMGYGLAVLYMFTTALHSGLLGALLTFAAKSWYPDYAATQSWNLTPLEDQQLGGLIMWVPAGLVYVVAGLALFAGWMRESQKRLRRAEQFSPATMSEAVPARNSL
jgi:putative membrane protein